MGTNSRKNNPFCGVRWAAALLVLVALGVGIASTARAADRFSGRVVSIQEGAARLVVRPAGSDRRILVQLADAGHLRGIAPGMYVDLTGTYDRRQNMFIADRVRLPGKSRRFKDPTGVRRRLLHGLRP